MLNGYIGLMMDQRKETTMKDCSDYNRPPPFDMPPKAKPAHNAPEANLFAALRALSAMASNVRSRIETIHTAFTGDNSPVDRESTEVPCFDGAFPLALRHVQYIRDDLTAIERLADRLQALLPKE